MMVNDDEGEDDEFVWFCELKVVLCVWLCVMVGEEGVVVFDDDFGDDEYKCIFE